MKTILAASVLAGLLLTSCGGADDGADDMEGMDHAEHSTSVSTEPAGAPDAAADKVLEISVARGAVTPAAGTVKLPAGSSVELNITSDKDDEVHVHGYDKHVDVMAGKTASLTLELDIPGRFEVELEDAGTLLVELEVA